MITRNYASLLVLVLCLLLDYSSQSGSQSRTKTRAESLGGGVKRAGQRGRDLVVGGATSAAAGKVQGPSRLRRHGRERAQRIKRGWVWNQFFVLEEYMGSEPQYVGKLHSDMDHGENAVKYTLSGEGAGSVFTIDQLTGDIHALVGLDREERSFYTLKAQAVDIHTGVPLEPESEFIIKVQDINDNEPRFTEGPYTASVPEMSPTGTYVTQVTATDADDPTYGSSARIVYSILQGQPYFSVDPKTGVIRTALANMDREVKAEYQVLLQAKDMGGQLGGLASTTTVNITLSDVNDNPPRFAKSIFHLRVPESAPSGSSVGHIRAHDADMGDNAVVEYAIVPGDEGDMFDISSTGQDGVVLLKKTLDYESKKSYMFKVDATNAHLDPRFLHVGPFQDSATVKVTVLDVDEPPVFTKPHYYMDTFEDTPPGTVIGSVTAYDLDASSSAVRYSLEWKTESDSCFDIDNVEGTISTNELLDRESTAQHNLTVRATKVSSPLLFSKVSVLVEVLDVNEFPPELFVPTESYVCEDARAGQVIQIVSAVDQDQPSAGQRFFFKSPKELRNRNFTVRDFGNNTAGIVTRRSGFLRHIQEEYLLPLVVEDSGYPAQSSTSTLTIRVCSCGPGGALLTCSAQAVVLPVGLSTGALMAILLCVALLMVMSGLYMGQRRHKQKEALMTSKEDIRDNVIHYDDEGGGEQDTHAYDMGTLRTSQSQRTSVQSSASTSQKDRPSTGDNAEIIRSFIEQRLGEGQHAALAYDSLATYAYEGEGSEAGSLSSIEESWVMEDMGDFSSLGDWGQPFKTLASILDTQPAAKMDS
ncbi:cadherin-12-like [Periophthalmus magnuspinnatus]|uniref:cadherin-12-like n=1 Tax=Periophthalmus magnuspinnatus TaxID=409849 RepID=UPI0024364247|nr:cadherin-12-like [Periophthalmus magnuspinnatus]